MEPNLELVRSKLTVKFLAEHSTLPDAESLLRSLRETVTYLERRIAREKILNHKAVLVVVSGVEAKAS